MRIALYISGKVRTLFYKFHKNIELFRDRYPNCEIDVFYSFWDSKDRTEKINDSLALFCRKLSGPCDK